MNNQTKKLINKCLVKIKDRDERYVQILYYLIVNKLEHIAWGYLRKIEDVQDVVQEFWANIYKISDNYIYSDNGYSFLCTVITRMSINSFKKIYGDRQRIIDFTETSHIDPFDENTFVEKIDYKIAVKKALDTLESLESVVIQMIMYEDKTIEQIAKDLKVSKSKVGRIKKSAEEKLKIKLADFNWEKSER